MLLLKHPKKMFPKDTYPQNAFLRVPVDSQENSKHSRAKDSVWSYLATTDEDPMLYLAARVPQNPNTPSLAILGAKLLRKGG